MLFKTFSYSYRTKVILTEYIILSSSNNQIQRARKLQTRNNKTRIITTPLQYISIKKLPKNLWEVRERIERSKEYFHSTRVHEHSVSLRIRFIIVWQVVSLENAYRKNNKEIVKTIGEK